MKKDLIMVVTNITRQKQQYALLELRPAEDELPDGIRPGMFAQVLITNSPSTYLRRPISICFADYDEQKIWLLVRDAGAGTHSLIESEIGQEYSVLLPLGNGFTLPDAGETVLLTGGGVGVAPLLYLGKELQAKGCNVLFAIGARAASDLLLLEEFKKYGLVHVATENGSEGKKGFVTDLPIFNSPISHIACCGPTPMMKAVAKIAATKGINCEVSLENMMACGLGACLCCVEDVKEKGNVCVCKDGPVFNINQLKWQI